MGIPLAEGRTRELESQHRTERDGGVRDRIKAVLLRSEGWTYPAIAQALRIQKETAREPIKAWETDNTLVPGNGGSDSKLGSEDTQTLEQPLEGTLYTRVLEICRYVKKTHWVSYTVSGMTKGLQQQGVTYKKPKAIPARADGEKQRLFIEEYIKLVAKTPVNESILCIDARHPTMATKMACGWIRKGLDKPISPIASRTRVNIRGALELSTMTITSSLPACVNGDTTLEFLNQLKQAYPKAPRLHVVLDQSGYHRSQCVQALAQAASIKLHYLPPHSPNLNSIERLGKVINEYLRNNRVFHSPHEFREAIAHFFEVTLQNIVPTLKHRINDNFQILNPVPSFRLIGYRISC